MIPRSVPSPSSRANACSRWRLGSAGPAGSSAEMNFRGNWFSGRARTAATAGQAHIVRKSAIRLSTCDASAGSRQAIRRSRLSAGMSSPQPTCSIQAWRSVPTLRAVREPVSSRAWALMILPPSAEEGVWRGRERRRSPSWRGRRTIGSVVSPGGDACPAPRSAAATVAGLARRRVPGAAIDPCSTESPIGAGATGPSAGRESSAGSAWWPCIQSIDSAGASGVSGRVARITPARVLGIDRSLSVAGRMRISMP